MVERKLGKYEKPVLNLAGKELDVIKLPESVFGVKVNEPLLLQAVRVYLANLRQGNASSKTRGQIRGGGRKPWRQKGTGNARQGSIRSPLWRGGGIVFGPAKRDFTMSLPTKMKRAALRSALSSKLGDLMVVDSFKLKEPKTKLVAEAITKLGIEGRTLFILPEAQSEFVRASRNLGKVQTTVVKDLNALQVIQAGKIVISRDVVEKFRGEDAS